MARIVTGRMRIELQPIASLAALVRLVSDSFRPFALDKRVSLHCELDAAEGPVEGDPERLQQVIWNLLSNSIRFTPPGGRIEIRCRRCGDDVEVCVRDSGRGIRPESIPHLFERYWQGQFDAQPDQGLGLGLAIAQRIVSLHSGTISAASEGEGRGATFTVRLPVSAHIRTATQATGADMPTAAQAMGAHVAAAAQGPLRILLIDDHDAIGRACQRSGKSIGPNHDMSVACQ